MRNALASALSLYRQYRNAKAKSRAYRLSRYLFFSIVASYLLLLSFPQMLFAHEMSYKTFTVFSREPFNKEIYSVLDRAEAKLAASPINTGEVRPRILLTGSQGFYSALSLNVGGNSFGKGFALLPTSNVFINRTDVPRDLVLRNAPAHNQRSLSEVIAHEVTHLMIRKKIGYWRNLTLPVWKREGFCEYVAGGSTLPYEIGVRMWKENPQDGTGYQYFKYYMMVKYVLEHEKLSVDQLFNRDIDVPSLEAKVLSTL
jgi:hypothetical protein